MRNKLTPNEIIDCGNYYEIILYDRYCKEKARTKVDKIYIDILKTHKWFIDNRGYVATMYKRSVLFLHQYLMGNKKGFLIDHRNRDKLDNRINNFRHITPSQNAFNRSGVKGIYKNIKQNKWVAQICCNYKQISLGLFDNKEDAIAVRQKAEIKYFGENNTI